MSDSLIVLYSRIGSIVGLTEMIAKGVDVNLTGFDGNTSLHYAGIYGHLEIVKVLVAAGAEVNKTNNDGDTALHCASALLQCTGETSTAAAAARRCS